MRRFAYFMGLLTVLTVSGSATQILTVYSDQGFPENGAGVFAGGDSAAPPVFEGTSTLVSPPEGQTSFRTQAPSWWFWGFSYAGSKDLSAYQELRFWVNSSGDDVIVELKNSSGTDFVFTSLSRQGWTAGDAGHWKLIRIPLTGAGISPTDLANFKTVAFSYGGAGTVYIDDVRFVDTTAAAMFDVAVLNNATNLPDTLSWSASLPAGWVLANQHVQLTIDSDLTSWGVQIYTDNTAATASPRFDTTAVTPGLPGSNPAGIVDSVTKTSTLPLAWTVKDSSITAVTAANPSNTSDPNSFQWLYLQDRATPTISAENSTAFVNGEPYATVKSNAGIHFGGGNAEFGGDNPPNNVFFEVNLSNAVTPRNYSTNTLTFEYFTL